MNIIKAIIKAFRKKSIHDIIADSKNASFERTLGAMQLVLMGIGAIVGAGIFVIAGMAAGKYAGPAITLSFMLAALACSIAGLCYAELSSTIPISGGAYTFTYVTLGELAAWLVMGLVLLTFALGAASVANGWSGYVVSFLHDYGISISPIFTNYTGKMVMIDGVAHRAIIDVPALSIVLLLSWIVHKGAQTAAWVNTLIVAIKMFVLSMFVLMGMFYIDPANWTPFIPEYHDGHFGLKGIVDGAAVIFIAFTGFDAVASTAQDTKNPQRDLPIGILGSLFICALFYIAIAAVLTGIVSYTQLNVPQPVALAVDKMQLPWFALVIKVGAISGLTSVVLVMLYSTVRVLLTVANDGLLPALFTKCNKKYHTPHFLTIVVGVSVGILGSAFPLENLVMLSNFGTLSTFAIVCFSTIYLRYTMPNLPRGFKCPFSPIVPIIGILLFGYILASIDMLTIKYAMMWLAFLTIVYFVYGRHNSHLMRSAR